jgi:hypothetical protein
MLILYRFCGTKYPHGPHLIYQSNGNHHMGAAHYNCIGHMVMSDITKEDS